MSISKNGQAGFSAGSVLVVLVMLAVVGLIGWRVAGRAAKPARTAPAAKTEAVQPVSTLKGVSLSPKSFSQQDFGAFLTEAVKDGTVLTWAGNWSTLEQGSSAPYVISRLSKQYGYQVVVIIGTDSLAAADKDRFVAAARSYASVYRPNYMGLGNEVNRLYASSPSNYATFKQWFAEAAVAVKQVSPNTKVFTTFQYEQLNGLNGGLFGGKNDPAAAQWQLLADFPSADLIAFTTYPYLIYSDPASIPADYYSRISAHGTKPVAFTEIGWPSGTEAAGYESTPQEQADFVNRFAALTTGLHARFVIWPFVYEQPLNKPFLYTGLIDTNGAPKPALDAWRSAAFQ